MSSTQHSTTRGSHVQRAILAGVVGFLAISGLAGCRGERSDKPPRQFFPDMDDQMKWKPQSGSEFYADGRTMRQPVAGTVAFGRTSLISEEAWAGTFTEQRSDLLRDDSGFYRGVAEDGSYLVRMPAEVTRGMLERGMERFNIYCSACHGYEGDGKGTVGLRWSYAPATFHDPKYRDTAVNTGRDGYLFHVARNGVIGGDGKQKMPGYGHALDERDAWAVVAYIRALQTARLASIDAVPPAEREIMERQRASAPPASESGVSASAGGAK